MPFRNFPASTAPFPNTALEYVTLGASVASIASSAFDECPNLEAFIVSDFNSHFSVDSSNALFNKDKTELYFVPKALSGSYTVPAGTKFSIGSRKNHYVLNVGG